MKKTIISFLALIVFTPTAAWAPPARGRVSSGGGAAAAPAAKPGAPVSARAGVRQSVVSAGAPAAAPAASAPKSTGTVAARAAARNVVATTPAPAASAGVKPAGGANSARAAATNKVINTGGAKINAAASAEGVVSPECKEKYFGCMDSFCMQDNMNGARCVCSDQVKTYDTILVEIEKLDAQSLKLATDGVDRIDMGEKADEIDKMVSKAAEAVGNPNSSSGSGSSSESGQSTTKKTKRRSLDLAAFDKIGMESEFEESINAFEIEEVEDPLEGLSGNALHDGVRKICMEQVGAGCEKDMRILQMLYQSQVKSDCAGYELELKKRRNASSQKLATAQRAMKDAALEAFDNQNKFDVGQCVMEMKKCVINTGGCGEDFAKCTYFNTSEGLGSDKKKEVVVPGTNIKVAQGTLDSVQSKRKLCETTVVKNCVSVKDEVWPSFLLEIAPTLKSAELLAENDTRQNILNSISECFVKACASKFDPNQKEADYDACLGNPEMMATTCKVVLDQAGIPISEVKNTGSSNTVWKFVVAKLAAMRVDACTNAIKAALEADTACGKGYIGCLSMDAEFFRDIIPPEKLVSCMKNGETITANDWTETGKIGNMVMGIMLNADNEALNVCTVAAAKQVMTLCSVDGAGYSDEDLEAASPGMLADCDAAFAGINSLNGFGAGDAAKVHELVGQKTKLVGLIDFTNFNLTKPGESVEADSDEYYPHFTFTEMSGASAKISNDAAKGIIRTIRSRIDNMLEGKDGQTLKFCTQGRDLSQIMARDKRGRVAGNAAQREQAKTNKSEARFPNLLDTVVENILHSGLRKAKSLYNVQLNAEAEKFQVQLREMMITAPGKGYIDDSLGICWHKNKATMSLTKTE